MLDFAAVSGFIFVALGAFGAHVLSKSLGAGGDGLDPDRPLNTGVPYAGYRAGLAWRCSAASASGFTGAAFSGAGYGAFQRQPLPRLALRICACGRLLHLSAASAPGGLGINVYRSYPSETQGRCS